MRSINELGMGRNTKLQLQFADRFWLRAGTRVATANTACAARSRRRGTSRARSAGAAGILNFFSGGSAAVAAGLPAIDAQARESLRELARYVPASERVVERARDPQRVGPQSVVARLVRADQARPVHVVLRRGGERAGHVYFAGEHTSIDSQGYMNGAVETGQRAAGRGARVAGGANVDEGRVLDAVGKASALPDNRVRLKPDPQPIHPTPEIQELPPRLRPVGRERRVRPLAVFLALAASRCRAAGARATRRPAPNTRASALRPKTFARSAGVIFG